MYADECFQTYYTNIISTQDLLAIMIVYFRTEERKIAIPNLRTVQTTWFNLLKVVG